MKITFRKLVPWLALGAVALVTVSPIEWRPEDIFGVNNDRALAFGVMSALFVYAYPRHWAKVAVAMVGISFGLELLQLFQESRHARLEDALVKATGATAGISVTLLARELRHMFFPRPAALPQAAIHRNWPDVEAVAMPSISGIFFSQTDGTLRLSFSDGEERLFAGIEEGEVMALINAPSQEDYYAEKLQHREDRKAA